MCTYMYVAYVCLYAYVCTVAGPGGGVGVITPPPLVAENFVCSNSNFSPTGAITPPPPPLGRSPPPPSENPVSAPVCRPI